MTQKEWLNLKILPKQSVSKRKIHTQQEYVWHLKTQPEGVPEVKKRGSKGRHIPTDSDRRSAPHPPTPTPHPTPRENHIVEIRRSQDFLISTMEFLILVRRYLYTESGLWLLASTGHQQSWCWTWSLSPHGNISTRYTIHILIITQNANTSYLFW